MALKNVESAKDFEEILRGEQLVVVHFWAEWAAQCKAMDDVMEELAKEEDLGAVTFARLLAENVPEVSLKYEVSAVPTILLFRSGQVAERVDGASAADLTKKVKKQASREVIKPLDFEVPKEEINSRLKKLINAAPVMLFMKGAPAEPRCGFSKQAVAILNNYNARYSTFDILASDEVRQGLKTFSNWPTYPQLYINGELIGGLDIMKEMSENGELAAMLPKKQILEERLQSLVKKHPLMIFMKGDANSPRCGFSRQLMEIVKETGLDFETFDILQDEEVRQGLKTFSNWPTYPQVYVKGELIGGLDILKEMKESGELMTSLRGDS